MKFKLSDKMLQNLAKGGIFLLALILSFQFLPRKERFRYQFQVGKPWQYELLTAPFDFPIEKTQAMLNQERDSILRVFSPFFRLMNLNNEAEFQKCISHLSPVQKAELTQAWTEIFSTGVMDIERRDHLENELVETVSVIEGNRSHKVKLEDIFTIRSAYEFLQQATEGLSEREFRELGVERLLVENLHFDESLTKKAREALQKQVSVSAGMVQRQERIIGPGEIVSERTYSILSSLRNVIENQGVSERTEYVMIAGELLYLIGLLLLYVLYLALFRQRIFASIKSVGFLVLMVVMQVVLASVLVRYTKFSIYLVPFAIQPIIVRIFFDSRTALFTHIISMLMITSIVAFPLEFIVLQITAGMTAVSTLKHLTQRSQLVQTAGAIVLSYSVMYTACVLMLGGAVSEIKAANYLYFAINGFLQLFAYGLIYIFEKMFGFVSDLTLVELSNVNNKLLMRFSEAAPGTFQHSLQVSNLATEAAQKIRANVLLVRAGALYHDIGKMANPIFFTENQPAGVSPLAELEYEEAAQIIINHVEDGVKIAQKEGLPEVVIDFIRMHHGKNKTKYFYNSFVNKYPDREIQEEKFTYPGPLPNSKESAILMMADAIEATSKSLQNHSSEAIDALVSRIIDAQIAEGAFINTPMTFRQLEAVKNTFCEKLKSIYHVRISYPELKKK